MEFLPNQLRCIMTKGVFDFSLVVLRIILLSEVLIRGNFLTFLNTKLNALFIKKRIG